MSSDCRPTVFDHGQNCPDATLSKKRLAELGYVLDETAFQRAFTAIIALADKKEEVTDKDIESILAEDKRIVADTYHLDRYKVTCGDRGIPTAAVRLIAPDGRGQVRGGDRHRSGGCGL